MQSSDIQTLVKHIDEADTSILSNTNKHKIEERQQI